MEMFTGISNIHGNETGGGMMSLSGGKREAGALFKPATFLSGTSAEAMDRVRNNYIDKMQLPKNRANELPFTQEVVGRPGVRGGKTGDVYYDERELTLPPTIDKLRSRVNPRETFEGRLIPGSSATTSTRRPEAQPILENKVPSLIREQRTTDDFIRTTGGVTGRTVHPKYEDKVTERQSTCTRSYAGVAKHTMPAASDIRSTKACGAVFRTPLGSLPRGHAVTLVKDVTDYGRGNILVYGNERDLTGTRTYRGNLATAVKAIIAPMQDMLRVSRKEELIDGPKNGGYIVGAGAIPKLTVYDSHDIARTTIKEGLINGHENGGNIVGAGAIPKLTVYDSHDIARTTIKEGLINGHENGGNIVGAGAVPKLTVYDSKDTARTTTKEGLINGPENGGNIVGAGAVPKPTVYDSHDVARTTIKETGIHDTHACGVGFRTSAVMRGNTVQPDARARTTIKEDTVDTAGNDKRNMFVNKASVIADADAWRPNATIRETTEKGNGGGADGGVSGYLQNTKTGAYTVAALDPPRQTQKETLSDTGTRFGTMAEAHTHTGGYTTAHLDGAKETMRHTMVDNDYYGAQAGSAARHTYSSHEAFDNAVVSCDREMAVSTVRDHIGSATKIAASIREIGNVTVEINPIREAERGNEFMVPDCQIKLNKLPHAGIDTADKWRITDVASHNEERMEQDVKGTNTQFDKNPFIHDITRGI